MILLCVRKTEYPAGFVLPLPPLCFMQIFETQGRLFFVSGQTVNTITFYEHKGGTKFMAFFASAIDTLKILVIALGAGLGAWGVINLLEGYGNDNPGAKSQGMKQFMAN